jgi:hypothetical protein
MAEQAGKQKSVQKEVIWEAYHHLTLSSRRDNIRKETASLEESSNMKPLKLASPTHQDRGTSYTQQGAIATC